jgi:hypothetical protein
MSKLRPFTVAVSAVVGLALLAPNAFAGAYPTNICVAAKLKAAAKKCKSDLTLWSKSGGVAPDPNDISATAAKLAASWLKAEDKATAKGVNCSDVSLDSATMSTTIEIAASNIAAIINPTLNLPTEAKCGAKLLKAAAKKCDAFLKADSKYITKLAKDPAGAGRTAARAKAIGKFNTAYGASGCSLAPLATLTPVETSVDTFAADVVTDTTTSPGMSTSWTSSGQIAVGTQVPYEGVTYSPVCSRNTPYQYWFKRGTVNKLLVYYQGGGACWDGVTCSTVAGAFDDDVDAGDNPANTTTGLGDPINVNNPFRDWSAVFISYCTGDIHWGDNTLSYTGIGTFTIHHKGYQNAKVVEKFAREHFVNPDEVFVTGSSAGAYGAVMHGSLLHEVYPASKFNVVGDAGNGVVTPTFIAANLEPSWKVQQHLPTYLGLNPDITTLSIADLYIAGANFYAARGSRYGQYTTAYDGGGGSQTFFYNVMANGVGDSGNWWHSSCDWNTQMLQNDADAEAGATNNNYRSYVGPGSRHTIYGSNRVYTETHGVPQTFISWLDDMRNNVTWNSVVCSDCSLLGSCVGGSNAGASCQHDSECPGGGVCNLVDVKPPFTCSPASSNPGASCQRDADCPGGSCQIEASFGVCSASSTSNANATCTGASKCVSGSNANAVCTLNSECPGGTCALQCPGGTCVTEQPFGLDGVVTCP